MVLTDGVIKAEMAKGNIVISNYNEAHMNPNSYDMTLGSTYKMYKNVMYNNGGILDVRKKNETEEFTLPESGEVLHPGHVYLYSCVENIGVKGDICATVMGKSSLGRLGLDIHITAGFIDSGFEGSLVLEMRPTYKLRIYPGMKICQVKFERTEGVPEAHYGEKPGSKYMGQEGVQESLYHLNYAK